MLYLVLVAFVLVVLFLVMRIFLEKCREPFGRVNDTLSLSLSKHATGYGRFFKSLRDFLYSQPDIANRIQVVEKMDRMTTGNFGTSGGGGGGAGPLLHKSSKKMWLFGISHRACLSLCLIINGHRNYRTRHGASLAFQTIRQGRQVQHGGGTI